jgi:hypothetical protein
LDGALYFEEFYCRVPEIPSIILAGSMTRFESLQHVLVIQVNSETRHCIAWRKGAVCGSHWTHMDLVPNLDFVFKELFYGIDGNFAPVENARCQGRFHLGFGKYLQEMLDGPGAT